MFQFLGTHQNRLDAKGRVSIPAAFRSALRSDTEGVAPLILRMSHKHPCIEGWPVARFQALATPLTQYNQFSDAHDNLSASLFADAFPAEADKEGRIVLPAELVEHAGLTNQVAFMGMGDLFQIWEPAAAARRRAEARDAARLQQLSLQAAPAAVAA
jgi:MraZ protein